VQADMTDPGPPAGQPAILKLHDAISHVAYRLGAVGLAAMVVVFSYEVFMRYALAAPTRWASDVVAFTMLGTVFLVAPWLARTQGHVAVTILPDLLPPRGRRWLVAAGYLTGAVVCAWAAFICAGEMGLLYRRGTMTLTSLRIPKWWLMAVMLYGLADCALHFLRAAAARVFSPRI